MNSPRKSSYMRKTTHLRPPSREADLPHVIWILEQLCKNTKEDPADPCGPGITKWPQFEPLSDDDDPIEKHIERLRRILKGQLAHEVFGQKPGSGRRAKDPDEHWALADFYLNTRGPEAPYRCTHEEACRKVRAERTEWKKYKNETIRKVVREQRLRPVAFTYQFPVLSTGDKKRR